MISLSTLVLSLTVLIIGCLLLSVIYMVVILDVQHKVYVEDVDVVDTETAKKGTHGSTARHADLRHGKPFWPQQQQNSKTCEV